MHIIELVAAERKDIEMLTALRIEVLLAANELPPDTDMDRVKSETKRYYESYLGGDKHIEYLAYVMGELAGCGAACIYKVMPTYHNPSGHKAYIMNMYTRPAFRRQGIARATLKRLVEEIRSRGIGLVGLEATNSGRPLYQSEGFMPVEDELYIDLQIQTGE